MVFVNDTCVLGYTHQDVVNMFQGIPIGERVTLEVCRGYSLPFDPNDPNTEIVTTVAVTLPEGTSHTTNTPSYASHQQQHNHKSLPDLSNNNIDKAHHQVRSNHSFDDINANSHSGPDRPELLSVNIVKGSMGFGFTIADSAYGQKVKQIMDKSRCQTLQEGDILVEINQIKVKDMMHADVVRVLKNCKGDVASLIVVQRGGILTPTKAKKNGKSVSGEKNVVRFNATHSHVWLFVCARAVCSTKDRKAGCTSAETCLFSGLPVILLTPKQRQISDTELTMLCSSQKEWTEEIDFFVASFVFLRGQRNHLE